MLRAAQEFVGSRLEFLDADALVRRQDAGGQDLHLGLVARVVLCHDRAHPVVVAFVGGLPGLALAQRRVRLGHLHEPAQDEVELDRHRLLAPERAVVVEHRQAVLDPHRLRPVLAADPCDELHDRPLRRTIPPARQPAHNATRLAFSCAMKRTVPAPPN